jgi:chemosensory pili system protein ChpC
MADQIPEKKREIRGLMVPITNGRVLLPNATIAEVITLSTPDRVPNAPEWLLGRVNWRGWRLPLFSFSLLSGMALDERAVGGRVCVMKALSGHSRMPFMAMLAQGFPRLTTITEEVLIPAPDGGPRRLGVLMDLLVRDDQVVIPNLPELEQLVFDVLNAPTPGLAA